MSGERNDPKGIKIFEPSEAPLLGETTVMSMPAVQPEAGNQFVEWASSPGHIVKVLFRQGGPDGMSLIWSWFGPGFPLPRHSHSADCLYYVVAGEAHLGSRVLRSGSGFFVPCDAPYAYTAGPEGVEVLEFRGVSSFDMKISESIGRWDHIVSAVREKSTTWKETAPSA